MVGAVGPLLVVILLVVGASFALAAGKRPEHAAAFERTGGLLLVSGLVLLGVMLSRGLHPWR